MKVSLLNLNNELQSNFGKQIESQKEKNMKLSEALGSLNELLKQRQE